MPAPSCPSALCLLLLLLTSCSREHQLVPTGSPASGAPALAPVAESASAPSPEAVVPTFALPYPRGAWRLAAASELDDVVLWFSQILIRHAEARNEVSFNLANWFSVPPASTRTREQAFGLARRISRQAAADPKRFAELARQYSEDLPRRDEGGAMGGVQAAQLEVWPQVLDALAAIAPGQTSEVVETRYGFHIFYRSAPPSEEVMSGAHIVIGHERAQWLGIFARDSRPSRSRDEALALAREVSAKARSAPARFTELVNEYSEHRDALVGGDFGAWSTREPIAYALRMKRLRELTVGEVGAPIETHLGFEIVQRTELRPRQQFRAKLLVFPPPELASEPPRNEPSERASLFAQADALARVLARDPARFAELSASAGIVQWEDGRGVPGLTAVLTGLRPGQVASSVVESEYGPVIAQRLELEPASPRAYKTDLPAPEQPDVEHFLAGLSGADSQAFLHDFAQQAGTQLGLIGAVADRLRTLHELQGRIDDDTLLEARLELFHGVLTGTQQLLGQAGYARYRAALNQRVKDVLLGAPADSLAERGF